MKTYYLIKIHAVATPDNPSFAGEEAFYYEGKEGYTLKATGSHIEKDQWNPFPKDYSVADIREYGYKRLCDAKRVANLRKQWYNEPKSYPYYWEDTVTIIAEAVAD